MTKTMLALPVVGAAMLLKHLELQADWLSEHQRDLEIQDPCLPGVLDGDGLLQAQAGRAILDRAGYRGRLGVHAAFAGLDLGANDPLVRAVVTRRYEQSLNFGAELGATHLVIHSPFVWFGNLHVGYARTDERQRVFDSAAAILEPLLPRAEQLGCSFVIEVIFDLRTGPLLDLVRAFRSPQVQLSVDVGHAFLNLQRGGPPPEQWLTDGDDVLGHVHLQDNDGQADRHWQVGQGALNWRSLFATLAGFDTRPRLILETEAFRESADWLSAQGLAR